jgi:Phospholipase_D-nuclease N-terminal
MNRKRWADLSSGQKMAMIVLGTIQFGLLAVALWDIAHRTADEVRGDRRLWAGIVFINWFGPLAYFTIGRKDGLCSRLCGSCCGSESTTSLTESDSEPFSL